MDQEFEFSSAKVEATLQFSQPVRWTVLTPQGNVVGTPNTFSNNVIFEVGNRVEITIPLTLSGVLTVDPTFELVGIFSSETNRFYKQRFVFTSLKLKAKSPGIGGVAGIDVDLGPLDVTEVPFFTVGPDTVGPTEPWEVNGFLPQSGSQFQLNPQYPPTAVLTGDNLRAEGQSGSWDSVGSNDPDGNALTYFWDFGDGASATGPSATHTYLDDASYTLQLTVTDIHGATNTRILVVTVTNVAPTVNAGSDKTVDEGTLVGLGIDLFGKNLIVDPDAENGATNWVVTGGFDTTNYRSPGVGENPDGKIHAEVTDLGADTFLVGFEGALGGGDLDYNDILFEVTATAPGDLTLDPLTGGVGATLSASVGTSISVDVILPAAPVAGDQVTSGNDFTCGLLADGIVECWGSNFNNFSSPYVADGGTIPDGTTFSQIDSSRFATCGILGIPSLSPSGTVECWGSFIDPGTFPPTTFNYLQVSMGRGYGCGVRTTGAIDCWGENGSGQASLPTTLIGATFSQVSAGFDHTCAVLLGSGGVHCWGNNSNSKSDAPGGIFLTHAGSISAGTEHTCGVKADGAFRCWGADVWGQASPPTAPIVAEIWLGPPDQTGSVFIGISDTVSTFGPHPVSAGTDLDFRIKLTDGTIFTIGQPTGGLPSGPFIQLQVGTAHSCGLKIDGTVECWGAEFPPELSGFDFGQTTPPDGVLFSQISSGSLHNCGIVDPANTVVCWGSDLAGQSTVPSGVASAAFTQISAGDTYTCGILMSNSTVVCWGGNSASQSLPPSGSFSQIDVFFQHTCGVRSDSGLVGEVACWGATAMANPLLPPVNCLSRSWSVHPTLAAFAALTVLSPVGEATRLEKLLSHPPTHSAK
jgi:alpha-tubulin suppressor-like RCC1 family protein